MWVEFETLPKHIAPLWDGTKRGDIMISSIERPRRSILIEVVGDAGDFSAEVQLAPAAPKDGWEHAVTGNLGEAALTINSRRRGEGGEANIDWSWHPRNASHREELASLQFLRAVSGKSTMRLMAPEDRIVFTEGPTPEIDFDENTAALTRVFEDVVSLEEWLSTSIEVPAEIKAGDANALHRIARLIEGIEGTWDKASFVLDPPGPKEVEAEGVFQLRQEMGARLFGHEFQLGELVTTSAGTVSIPAERTRMAAPSFPRPARLDVEKAGAFGAPAVV